MFTLLYDGERLEGIEDKETAQGLFFDAVTDGYDDIFLVEVGSGRVVMEIGRAR